MALISAAVFGFAYGLIAMSARKKLLGNSQIMAYEQNRVVRALQEGLGAIRDVLLDGTQNVYVDIYAGIYNYDNDAGSPEAGIIYEAEMPLCVSTNLFV